MQWVNTGRLLGRPVFDDPRVGATCLGDADVAATLSALYTRALPVPVLANIKYQTPVIRAVLTNSFCC